MTFVRYRLSVLALAFFSAGGTAIAADSIPRWDIGEICATSTLGEQCPRIESQNRRSVFNRWEAVREDARNACAGAVIKSGKLSYKQLLSCLEDVQMKALDETPHSAVQPHHDS